MVFAFVIAKTDKDQGKLSGKNYNLHIFLAWLLLVLHSTGFKMLGWAVSHPKSIFENFFIPVGPLPAWFNLSTYMGRESNL